MKISHILSISGMLFCIPLVCTTPACAYIDPGTGSMVVQAVIAVIAIAGASVGMFWKRLKSFFGGNKKGDKGGK